MIYLSSPYTAATIAEMHERAEAAAMAAGFIISRRGLNVFSPVVHGHAIEQSFGAIPYDDWMRLSISMLDKADYVYVLTLPGWIKSAGVRREVGHAMRTQKPVWLIEPPVEVGDELSLKLVGSNDEIEWES